jgi:hypothetical protein
VALETKHPLVHLCVFGTLIVFSAVAFLPTWHSLPLSFFVFIFFMLVLFVCYNWVLRKIEYLFLRHVLGCSEEKLNIKGYLSRKATERHLSRQATETSLHRDDDKEKETETEKEQDEKEKEIETEKERDDGKEKETETEKEREDYQYNKGSLRHRVALRRSVMGEDADMTERMMHELSFSQHESSPHKDRLTPLTPKGPTELQLSTNAEEDDNVPLTKAVSETKEEK